MNLGPVAEPPGYTVADMIDKRRIYITMGGDYDTFFAMFWCGNQSGLRI